MANISKQSGYIAKAMAAEIKNEIVFLNNVNTDYTKEFKTQINGFKVGETIYVNKPMQLTSVDGTVSSDMTGKFKDIQEEKVALSINSNPIIGTNISDVDAITALGKPGSKEWAKRVVGEVAATLASDSEVKALDIYAKNADLGIVVETVTDAAPLKGQFKKANSQLAANRAPSADRLVLANTDVMNLLSDEVENYFNPSKDAVTAYQKAIMGNYGGMKFLASELIPVRVNGAGGQTLTVNGAKTGLVSEITFDAVTNLVVGDRIEFTFNTVDPQSKAKTAKKATRVVKAINGLVVTVNNIYTSGEERQNVDTASIADGSTVTVQGIAGESYAVCPVYQKKAFVAAPIELPKLGALDKINASAKIGSMSPRIASGDDINTGASKQRAEVMHAFGAIRPEWCGVVEVNIDLLG